ncbi:hypothetical protein LTR64_008799 [Lithohypha guttulata]|uniref:uncharacterized protein n=1 Tax=Lithohypha guttulata TaxID=1690604 RepID=UPI00315CBF54
MSIRSLLAIVWAVTPVIAETIHGVLVFTRHGDRTAKYHSGYQMTNLGASQLYDSGRFYRQRYVENGAANRIAGIASNQVNNQQVWARAPDQAVLYQSATNFLQGLYPPLNELESQSATKALTITSNTTGPLNGYQFILIHGEGETDPDTIWIKGDDACPAYSRASESYTASIEYKATLDKTSDFYSQLANLLAPVMGEENVTYKNAYDVFDLLNVATIHNGSIVSQITADDLDQLRYFANEYEWNHNFNASQPGRSIGGMSLAGAILQRLQATIDTSAVRNKFQLMAGSYDTFLAFFGLTNLTAAGENFYGLPEYAASMAFELFTEAGDLERPASFPTEDAVGHDLKVRFLFRNGTDGSDELAVYPLFGGSELAIPYGQFADILGSRAINSVRQWCVACGSTQDFCVAANATSSAAIGPSSKTTAFSSRSALSNAAAGGIGAGITLAVVAIIGGVLLTVLRKRKQSHAMTVAYAAEKRSSGSDSDSV